MAPGSWTLTFSQVTTWIFARSLLNAGLLRYFFGIAGLYGLLRFIATHFLKQVAISGRDDGLMHPLTLKKRSQKRPCVLIKWEDTIELLDRFCIDHAYPSWPVNRWITALFQLFRPQMITLLHQRDQTVRDWVIRYPERDVFADRELEVTSSMRIDTEHQITKLQAVSAQENPPRLTIAQ